MLKYANYVSISIMSNTCLHEVGLTLMCPFQDYPLCFYHCPTILTLTEHNNLRHHGTAQRPHLIWLPMNTNMKNGEMADPHLVVLPLCLLLALLRSAQGFGIDFTKWPDSEVVAIPGTQVVFSCSTNITADKVGWLYNHHRLYPQQHQQQKQPKNQRAIRPHHQQQDFTIRDTEHGSQLTVHLRSINYKHQLGLYQCVAHLGSEAVTSLPGRLSAATLAPFTTRAETSRLTVLEGAPARIPCKPPFSVPTATIAFLKNVHPLETDNSTTYRISSEGDLLIKKVKASDHGNYKCRAHNSALEAWHSSPRTVRLTVKPKDKQMNATSPQIIYPRPARNPQHRERGSSVHMICLASGIPAPNITWTRYGNQLPEKAVLGSDGSLILDNLDLQDQGTYLCHASNGVGPEDRINVNIDVIELPLVNIVGSVHRIIQEGASMLLRCSMTGHPVPDVMWFFNGRKFINDGNIFIDGPKIKIVSVAAKHGGIYQCFASNIGGWSEASVMVQVVDSETNVTTDHSHYDDYELPDFTISHDLNNGRKNIEWNREGKVTSKRRNKWNNKRNKVKNVPRGDDLFLDNGEERIEDLSNHEEGTMVPPSAPNVTKISDDSVMVTWAAPTPSGLSILFYKVQYRELRHNRGGRSGRWNTVEEDIPSHVTSYQVTELRAGNLYKFRIAAVYANQDNDIGPTSKRFLLEKDPTMSPPLYPPNVTSVERLSDTSIQLKWTYDITPGIDILGFFISYRGATNAGPYTKVTVLGNDTTSFVVTNLKSNISYDFKLQSFNLAGTSEFSSIAKRDSSGSEVISSPAPGPTSFSSPEVVRSTSSLKLKNFHLYLILGGLLAALLIIVIICYAVYSYKNKQHQVSRDPSMYEDTSLHIHRETSTYRLPQNHSDGETTNGYLPHQEKHVTNEIAKKMSVESSLVDNNNAQCFSSRSQISVPDDGQTSVHHTPSQTDITLDRRKLNSEGPSSQTDVALDRRKLNSNGPHSQTDITLDRRKINIDGHT